MRVTPCALLLAVLACSLTVAQSGGPQFPMAVVTIFTNENGERIVVSAPSQPTSFALTEPTYLTLIRTHHYNRGRGATPGTISLRNSKGDTVGSWAAALNGTYYWTVEPRLVFPPDTYTIVDSQPATWSHNAKSGSRGFATVNGAFPAAAHKSRVQGLFRALPTAVQINKTVVPLRSLLPLFFAADDRGGYWSMSRPQVFVGETLELTYGYPRSKYSAYEVVLDPALKAAVRELPSVWDTPAQAENWKRVARWATLAPASGNIRIAAYGHLATPLLTIPVVIRPLP